MGPNMLFDPIQLIFGISRLPTAERVIFNGPATIVIWADGTKTVVKCGEGDTFSKETGIALCFMKKAMGNTGRYNKTMKRLLKESKDG